jgi:hypothetical protein
MPEDLKRTLKGKTRFPPHPDPICPTCEPDASRYDIQVPLHCKNDKFRNGGFARQKTMAKSDQGVWITVSLPALADVADRLLRMRRVRLWLASGLSNVT